MQYSPHAYPGPREVIYLKNVPQGRSKRLKEGDIVTPKETIFAYSYGHDRRIYFRPGMLGVVASLGGPTGLVVDFVPERFMFDRAIDFPIGYRIGSTFGLTTFASVTPVPQIQERCAVEPWEVSVVAPAAVDGSHFRSGLGRTGTFILNMLSEASSAAYDVAYRSQFLPGHATDRGVAGSFSEADVLKAATDIFKRAYSVEESVKFAAIVAKFVLKRLGQSGTVVALKKPKGSLTRHFSFLPDGEAH